MLVHSRVARPASPAINFAKAMGHTALLWAVFFLGLPAAIHWLEDRTGLAAGRFDIGPVRLLMIAVFFGAAAVGISGGYRLTMLGDGTPMPLACTRRLVIAGPYCYIRNPMAAMGILQGIAISLYLGSWVTVVYSLVGALAWNFIFRPWEEADLARRFGPAYEEYRRSVPCWRPRLTPYRPSEEVIEPVEV